MPSLLEFSMAEAVMQSEFVRRKKEVPEMEDDLGELAEGLLSEMFADKPGDRVFELRSSYLKTLNGVADMETGIQIEHVENLQITPVTPVELPVELEEPKSELEVSPSLTESTDHDIVEHEESKELESDMTTAVKAMSFEQIHRKLDDAVMREMGWDFWLLATFPEFAIVNNSRTADLFQVPYTITGTEVELGEPVAVEQEFVPVGAKSAIRILRNQRTGEIRWVSISSNTFWDSYDERFSREALQGSVNLMQKAQSHGELRVEHHPASKVGMCDFSKVAGDFLIESGTFDDTVRAQKAIETLETDEENKLKISIGFFFNEKNIVEGVHTAPIAIFERSITGHASNPLTAISIAELGGIMDKAQVKERLAAIIGDDEADKVVSAGGDSLGAILEALGVKSVPEGTDGVGFRDDDASEPPKATTTPEPELPKVIELTLPDGEVVEAHLDEEEDMDLKALIASAVTEAVKPLTERLEAVEEGAKAQDTEAPRAVRYRITKDGKDVGLKASEEDVKEAEESTQTPTPFWSTMKGGR